MNFYNQLQAFVERVNNALDNFIKSQQFKDTTLIQAIEYSALLGGKRLRPLLVYATGNMFNVSNDILDVPAAAIECIHAYSLAHDDLPAMDNGRLRRGLPTCHIKYGEYNAILAGDALQTLAFFILSNSPMSNVTNRDRLAMIRELAMASGITGMCGGQALDLESEGKKITLEELERIHKYKTGKLIRAAVRLGAISAGERSRDVISILDRYSECIGLAFQVQDDILDILSDNTKLNKRFSTEYYKITYPALLGIDQARCKARSLINEAHYLLKQLDAKSLDISILEALADYIIQREK